MSAMASSLEQTAIGGLPPRPHLTLVPSGRAAAEKAPLRVTRFGRLVTLAVVVVTVAALATGLLGQLASASGPGRAITVESGQTLSEIAARELPGISLHDGVVALQLANDLSSDQVHSGQHLVVPRP